MTDEEGDITSLGTALTVSEYKDLRDTVASAAARWLHCGEMEAPSGFFLLCIYSTRGGHSEVLSSRKKDGRTPACCRAIDVAASLPARLAQLAPSSNPEQVD